MVYRISAGRKPCISVIGLLDARPALARHLKRSRQTPYRTRDKTRNEALRLSPTISLSLVPSSAGEQGEASVSRILGPRRLRRDRRLR